MPPRCDEHPVGVLEPSGIDAVDPDHKGLAEGGARLRRWADEVRDHGAAGFDNAIAHPAHAARMLDTILMAEAEVARQIGANRVGVENHRIEERSKRARKSGLAGAREPHDENFRLHVPLPIPSGRLFSAFWR
jgi:predicted NAD/FAD-binding protein